MISFLIMLWKRLPGQPAGEGGEGDDRSDSDVMLRYLSGYTYIKEEIPIKCETITNPILFISMLQAAAAKRKREAEEARLRNGATGMESLVPISTPSTPNANSNGTAKSITQNGTNGTSSNKAADYYVRGDVPADITHRKIQ